MFGVFRFVCFEFFVPLENFSLIWRRHHCRIRAVNFDLCSVLMAIDEWEFFSVPHLLPVVTTCFNDWSLSRLGFEHPAFRLLGGRSTPVRHSCNNITVTILIKLFSNICIKMQTITLTWLPTSATELSLAVEPLRTAALVNAFHRQAVSIRQSAVLTRILRGFWNVNYLEI